MGQSIKGKIVAVENTVALPRGWVDKVGRDKNGLEKERMCGYRIQ